MSRISRKAKVLDTRVWSWCILTMLAMSATVQAQVSPTSFGSGTSAPSGANAAGSTSGANSSPSSGQNMAPSTSLGTTSQIGQNLSINNTVSSGTTSSSTTSSGVSPTNVFAPYYANPYAGGISSTGTTAGLQSVFGLPIYTTTMSTNTNTITLSRMPGTSGSTGSGSGTLGAYPSPTYSVGIGFKTPPPAMGKVQRQIQGLLTNSRALSGNRAIQVETSGDVLVLRGNVANEHDRRLAQGIASLTPGVHEIRNELTVSEETPPASVK
ncbi:MAG TPA: BON domain-containing protein [Gemmataceae bacterium]|nr:BON domain-containing protein [Gemmataceae bacterium]